MAKHTALQVKSFADQGRHGDGLYLHVAPSGPNSWVQGIVIDGRRRDIGLGSFPTVNLSRAWGMAASNRAAVAHGRNPLAEKCKAKASSSTGYLLRADPSPRCSLGHRTPSPHMKQSHVAAKWTATLKTYAFPVLGDMAVDLITAADALAVLEPIWTARPETVSRARQRMETVLDWAAIHGYRLDNPAGRSLLKVLLVVKRLKNTIRRCLMNRCLRCWTW